MPLRTLKALAGLYEDVIKDCVQMVCACESKIVRVQKATEALMQTTTMPSDVRDVMSMYRNELYTVDATARPNNVRVAMEVTGMRRQKFYQEQLEARQHLEAETESMRDLRTSLKQSAVSAKRKSIVGPDITSAVATTAAAARRSTIS